ncbi:hypothetical protein DMH01_38125 [Amycolatopsis sp. WAC 04182]|nr:hypothetical protein DMH01_38125 [Amycolatopsis sp. WAC 04182]
MLSGDSMLDERLPVATLSAAPQVRVELLQALGRVSHEQDQRKIAEHRTNVIPNHPLVVHAGRGIDLRLRKH